MDKITDLLFNTPNKIVFIWGAIISALCYYFYRHTKSRPLLSCLPGVWTSLGLLGTFFSICISFNALPDPQNINIHDFIKQVIPAFTTSIEGLIFALITTVWAKIKFAKEDSEESEHLDNTSPEEYIRHIAQRAAGLNNIIKEGINKLDNSINGRSSTINDCIANLEASINDQGSTISADIANLNNSIKNQNNVLQKFVNDFTGRMDDIFKEMRGSMEQMVQTYGNEQFARTSEVLENIATQMSGIAQNIIIEQGKSVSKSMEATNNGIEGIRNTMVEKFSTMMTQMEQSLTKLNEKQQHNIQDSQERMSESLESTINANKATVDNLRSSMEDCVNGIHEEVRKECDGLGAAIKENVESLRIAYDYINSLMAEIRQNYDAAAECFGEAVKIADHTNDSSRKSIDAANKSLEAVEKTNERVAQVIDTLDKRQENIEQLTKSIHSMSATIEELQKLESDINEIIHSRK